MPSRWRGSPEIHHSARLHVSGVGVRGGSSEEKRREEERGGKKKSQRMQREACVISALASNTEFSGLCRLHLQKKKRRREESEAEHPAELARSP